MKDSLPSTFFQNSYAIFISRESASEFSRFIMSQGFQKSGVGVLNAVNRKHLSCIVIPYGTSHTRFEAPIFEFKKFSKSKNVVDSEFWGQYGIGYQDEYWTPLAN